MEKKMMIEGMSCGHCSARVEKALNALEGVSAKVDLEAKCAAISTQGKVSDEQLKAAVVDAGYEVVSLSWCRRIKSRWAACWKRPADRSTVSSGWSRRTATAWIFQTRSWRPVRCSPAPTKRCCAGIWRAVYGRRLKQAARMKRSKSCLSC